MEENNVNTASVKSTKINDFLEIIESTVITIFVIIMLFTYIMHPVNVVGSSMVPTLTDGDQLFMSTIVGELSYGDVIVINNDQAYLYDQNGEIYSQSSGQLNECIIKRVIAVGGQQVNVDEVKGEVSVDGVVLEEDYINEITSTNDGAFTYPITVPEGYYFVMGDNRNHSSDSRNPLVGLIKKDQVYGKAFFRYAPISDAKIL